MNETLHESYFLTEYFGQLKYECMFNIIQSIITYSYVRDGKTSSWLLRGLWLWKHSTCIIPTYYTLFPDTRLQYIIFHTIAAVNSRFYNIHTCVVCCIKVLPLSLILYISCISREKRSSVTWSRVLTHSFDTLWSF